VLFYHTALDQEAQLLEIGILLFAIYLESYFVLSYAFLSLNIRNVNPNIQ